MSNTGSLGPIARLAGVLSAFALAVCAAGAGQGQGRAAAQQAVSCPKARPSRTSNTSARTASPETELEEALALRKRLTERDLRNALRLLADSAQQFASSGQPHRQRLQSSKPGMCIS